VDVLGHLGGFITGLIVGLWLIPPIRERSASGVYREAETSNQKCARITGIISTIVFFGIFFALFYTVREVPK